MSTHTIDAIKATFHSRLLTLEHLLKTAQAHFGDSEAFLQERLAADMFPLGTQIAFTCNQPRNFALWCSDQPMDNLNPEVTSLAQAYEHIANTQNLLAAVNADDAKLDQMTHLNLGPGIQLEFLGSAYVNEFLMPNLYFHLVTAYAILRMAGVPLGKRDYMTHLAPFLKPV